MFMYYREMAKPNSGWYLQLNWPGTIIIRENS